MEQNKLLQNNATIPESDWRSQSTVLCVFWDKISCTNIFPAYIVGVLSKIAFNKFQPYKTNEYTKSKLHTFVWVDLGAGVGPENI